MLSALKGGGVPTIDPKHGARMPNYGTERNPDIVAKASEEGYAGHSFFPNDTGTPETRDIRYISCRRKGADGKVEHSLEDIPADQIVTWADVVRRYGGGEYKAVAKDKNHKIVAWYPAANDGWLLFDLPSAPFPPRDDRASPGRQVAPRTALQQGAAAPAPAVAPAVPVAPASVNDLLLLLLQEQEKTKRMVIDMALRPRAPAPAVTEPVREAAPHQGSSAVELAPRQDSSVVELMRLCKEIVSARTPAPPPPQPSMAEQMSYVRALYELTRPAPPPPAEPSVLGEIKRRLKTLVQADAQRASAMPPEQATGTTPCRRRPHLRSFTSLGWGSSRSWNWSRRTRPPRRRRVPSRPSTSNRSSAIRRARGRRLLRSVRGFRVRPEASLAASADVDDVRPPAPMWAPVVPVPAVALASPAPAPLPQAARAPAPP